MALVVKSITTRISNPSPGERRANLAPWRTLTGFRIFSTRRAAPCSFTPACVSRSTKGLDEPSSIGSSGPSSSAMMLSTPSPEHAARKCSTVATEMPAALLMLVPSSVVVTIVTSAGMTASRSVTSARTNRTPAPSGAGRMVRVAGSPECTPTPERLADCAMVCWRFMGVS